MFLTNLRVRGWMDYDNLRRHRDDLIMVSLLGTRDGHPAVDYTVDPAVGFPFATGPEGSEEPVCHTLPAWDCIAGQTAALALLGAERNRRRTGQGQLIEFALKDVALVMLVISAYSVKSSSTGSIARSTATRCMAPMGGTSKPPTGDASWSSV